MKSVLFFQFIFLVSLFLNTGAVGQNTFGHVIPTEKNLSPEWQDGLYMRGKKKIYRGEELKTIGMPCGGIAAGQLYVRGDGTLAGWWIANNAYNTGYGIDHLMNFETTQGPYKVCYQTFEPTNYFDQGFNLTVRQGKKVFQRSLDKKGFDNIGFTGEYPLARIDYDEKENEFPLQVQMDVFSPFIPLNARESATPGVIMKFRVSNNSKASADVSLSGYLQNMVMADLKGKIKGKIRNRIYKEEGAQSLYMDFIPADASLATHAYNGNMSLTLLSGEGTVSTDRETQCHEFVSKELGEKLVGSVDANFRVKKGETKEVIYFLTWYFPNRPKNYGGGGNWNKPIPFEGPSIGNMYANWFDSSLEVASYLKKDFQRLQSETFRFHEAWYNQTTLPYWLVQRIMMPVSTLATETCQWWATDKFWAWEGVGSCVGTCTHVWNYEQALARLFPELERNIREKTDFGDSFQENGSILARNGWGGILIDGHAGAVLKAYREYLMSKDHLFLSRNWDKIKKATEYLIQEDDNEDGLIEKGQSNTYDIAFHGANTYVGGLYLGALKAAAQMARVMGDEAYAKKCIHIFEKGKELSAKRLWNGEYFFQDVDLEKYPKYQYGNGCLSDQLFGQTWAHQMKLGYIYPEPLVKKALGSVWKYNWTADVGPHNSKFVPERYYAHAGEPGLLNCSWPISKHLDKDGVRYRNEVWTGIEYQVATNMIYEGMIDEGLSIVKGVHERYRPEKHNPWNEIECGDHYARALASWGILIALEDYFYNGPKATMAFDPKIQKDDFTGFFTAAQAWGNLKQVRKSLSQENVVEVLYGNLKLKELQVGIPEGYAIKTLQVVKDNRNLRCNFKENGKMVQVNFPSHELLKSEKLEVKIKFRKN